MLSLKLIALVTVVTAVLAQDLVVLKQGSLTGHRLTSHKGRTIFAFQGIPYAKPPVGDLRFQPPQPQEPWEGVLDATKEGSICVQRSLFPTDTEILGHEDCLYLNVYTPKRPGSDVDEEPLDVMFWIHGGGFYFGSGNADQYGPQYLLDKDVILVTINYRLGAIGFLSTGDEVCPGNNGLKDQVAALRWVKDNIAAFGGEPNSVTIFGESAGGISVHFHVLSPLSKGLFHRAISQSGNAFTTGALASSSTSKHLTKKLGELFDCPTQPSGKLISCLKTQDAHKLFASDRTLLKGSGSTILFPPVIESEMVEDETFIADYPIQTLLRDDLDLVPWMVGITSGDGALFLNGLFKQTESEYEITEHPILEKLFDEDKVNGKEFLQKIKQFYFGDERITKKNMSSLVDMATDTYFLVGTNTAVKLHSRRDATVYYYYFDYHGSISHSKVILDPTIDYGVVHVDDLIYLFPQYKRFPNWKMTPQDEHMMDFMTTLWVNFARKGTPTPSWNPVSSPDVLEYVTIDVDGLRNDEGLLSERVKFWESLPIKNKYPTISTKDEL